MNVNHHTTRRGIRLMAGAAILAAGLVAGIVRPAAAQITIDPTTATSVWVAGSAWPGHATNPVKNTGGVISYYYTNSYLDIPFTVDSAGLYSLDIPVASTTPDLKAQVHVRAENSTQWWGSEDITPQTSGDWGTFVAATVSGIPIFQPGNHILRVANVRLQRHSAADREPGFENATGDGGPNTGPARGSAFNFGIMTLTRTGDLPAVGTVTGTVTSSDLGGIPVAGAYVMAVVGADVAEPGPLWQKDYWTTTDANGAYTLTVIPGTGRVRAGQPSMYAYSGATTGEYTLGAGETVTAHLDLASRWTTTDEGKKTVQVEVEYFIGKNPDAFNVVPGEYNPSPVVVQGRPIASNGMNAGFVDIGNYIDVPVDVPKGRGGLYNVADLYFNGWWDGFNYFDAITRVTANPGTPDASFAEATEPNTTPKDEFDVYVGAPSIGYVVPATVAFADAIRLKEGHNIVRVQAMGTAGSNAASAWDAITLTEVNVPVPAGSAAKALKVAAGLEAVSPTEVAALNVVTTGDSADRVDILDAVELARQGKL